MHYFIVFYIVNTKSTMIYKIYSRFLILLFFINITIYFM